MSHKQTSFSKVLTEFSSNLRTMQSPILGGKLSWIQFTSSYVQKQNTQNRFIPSDLSVLELNDKTHPSELNGCPKGRR